MKLSKKQYAKHRTNEMIYGVSYIEQRKPNIWQRVVAFFKKENPNYVVLSPNKIRLSKVKEVGSYPMPKCKINEQKNT